MKFTIENVGPIKKSEMEFGDLTILCGKNNTGKTYITYNTFNFFDAIKYFLHIPVKNGEAEQLLKQGKLILQLEPYFYNANDYIKKSMMSWIKQEAAIQMASHENLYKNISMNLTLDKERLSTILLGSDFSWSIQMTKNCSLKVSKNKNETNLKILLQNQTSDLPDIDVVNEQLEMIITAMIKSIIPDLFIITCERTGAAAFRSTFVASREIFAKQNADSKLIAEVYQKVDFRGYPRPMNKDLEFVVRFDEASQYKSFIVDEHPEILQYFEEIINGKYQLVEPNIVKFIPNETEIGLTTLESSSSIRSLMELNFYLKHKAKKYQCLIIDEPELNLHPEIQRKIARLLAMLINSDIYVAITTHSDYIIREFDFMTRLYSNPDLAEKLGYNRDQLLKADRIKTYVTSPIGNTGKYELKEISVSEENGIESSSFDTSIEDMNFIQQAIQMGEVMSDDDFVFLDNNCGREQ